MLKSFADVLDVYNGKNQKQVEDIDGVYPIYGSGGIMGYANDYICPESTVIIGRKGSINKPIYVTSPLWNVDTAFGLVAKKDILNSKYLYYFCEYFDFERLNTTVTIPSLTKANLLKIRIEVPELNVQANIVERLDKVNYIIHKCQEELELLDNLIKSRFVEMFGDPVSNPMGWKQGDMSSVCVKITDGEHGSVPRSRRGRIFLNAKHIRSDGNIDFYTATYIDDVAHERIYKRCNPEQGDILLTTTGTIGNVAIVPPIEEFSMDRGITLLKLDKTLCECTFIANLLRCKSMQNIMKANIHASAIGHLFLNKVMKLPVIVPPIELQNQFADFVIQTTKLKLVG